MKKIIAIILSSVVLSNLTIGAAFAEKTTDSKTSESQNVNKHQGQETNKNIVDLISDEGQKVNISDREKYIESLKKEVQKTKSMSNIYYISKIVLKVCFVGTVVGLLPITVFDFMYERTRDAKYDYYKQKRNEQYSKYDQCRKKIDTCYERLFNLRMENVDKKLHIKYNKEASNINDFFRNFNSIFGENKVEDIYLIESKAKELTEDIKSTLNSNNFNGLVDKKKADSILIKTNELWNLCQDMKN